MKLRQSLLACCIAAASLTLPTAAVQAAAPMVQTQAAGWYRVMLGDFEITALSDGTVAMPMEKLLHNDQRSTKKALAAHYQRTPVETSVNAFLVNTGDKLILIDAGSGSLFGPTLGKLTQNLKASGYTPEQVDEIYITHMHPDHVGGLTANGQRVFVNAVVRIEQGEADYWMSADNLAKAPADSKGFFEGAKSVVKMAFLGGELVSGYAAYFRARHGGPAGLYIGGYANEVCCYVPSDELLPPIAPWDSYEGGWTADYPGIAGGSMTIYPQLGHFRAGPAGAEATLIAAVTAQLG